MSLYAISDLHLSTHESTDKSMEVFGARWQDYVNRLERAWRHLVTDNDTVVIPGDVSWALSLEEAVCDLKFIDSLPGKKLLLKGNHDFWWSTMKKHEKLFSENEINTIDFIFNNAKEADGFILAGTRGWYHDEDVKNAPSEVDFQKLVAREEGRLRTSLKAAAELRGDSEREIIVFMHFPPFWSGKASEGIISLLHEYGIKRVYFGHIHGNYTLPPVIEYEGISMSLVSADYLNFTPKIITKAL